MDGEPLASVGAPSSRPTSSAFEVKEAAQGPSEKELSDEKYDNPSVLFKHVFDEPLEIVEATYVSKSRPCIKPVIAPRRKGAEKDVKVLRISFQGHEDEGIDIRATKAKYHYEDMCALSLLPSEGNLLIFHRVEKAADYEIEWPVDVDVKKSKA